MSLANFALCQHLDAGRYFVSAEDLTTIPVVSLHQDIVHVAALGIGHLERNGHHYIRGLDHLSVHERRRCLVDHGDLYRTMNDSGFMDIRGGRIAIGSLQIPGMGIGGIVESDVMRPLTSWLEEN